MKVIFHIDELSKWAETQSNVRNLLKETLSVKIIVLVNGKAIRGYLLPEYQEFITNHHVEFHACNNALHAATINPEQLPSSVKVVPAGVLDLIERQSEGYAYIKP
ncbi:MAG: DsrE family protein [Enterococcus sp.]